MQHSAGSLTLLTSDQYHRATQARDPRFDGVFSSSGNTIDCLGID